MHLQAYARTPTLPPRDEADTPVTPVSHVLHTDDQALLAVLRKLDFDHRLLLSHYWIGHDGILDHWTEVRQRRRCALCKFA